jgi:hypothetical protein
MQRFINSLLKGIKGLVITLVGSSIGLVILELKDIHPSGIAGIVWKVVGISVVTGILVGLQRALGYDPNKDPKVVGTLVPTVPVPPPNAK